LAVAGLGPDISAEALLMSRTAAGPAPDASTIQSLAVLLTGYVANGLYTFAGILLTVAGRRDLPPRLVALGAVAWTCGLGSAASTLVRASGIQIASTAVLMPVFIA